MIKEKLEKFGSFGSVLAAAACPVCFPKLALLGTLFGFGALAKYEVIFFYGAQFLVILAVAGHVMSYKTSRNWKILSLALVSAVSLFVSLYVAGSEILSYLAFAGLVVATLWQVYENRQCEKCLATSEQ